MKINYIFELTSFPTHHWLLRAWVLRRNSSAARLSNRSVLKASVERRARGFTNPFVASLRIVWQLTPRALAKARHVIDSSNPDLSLSMSTALTASSGLLLPFMIAKQIFPAAMKSKSAAFVIFKLLLAIATETYFADSVDVLAEECSVAV
ncbi:MAG TPA: hypothetical protein VIT88_06340 [Pyrinomonadaceae bacterium]